MASHDDGSWRVENIISPLLSYIIIIDLFFASDWLYIYEIDRRQGSIWFSCLLRETINLMIL